MMDDPLRQKSVPLAAETVLWFEFLIDPSLLSAYLKKNGNGGPTPIELINQFLAKPNATFPVSVQSISDASTTPTTSSTSPPQTPADVAASDSSSGADAIDAYRNIGRKQLAQKLLSLKVASHLRWDLSVIERNLTLQKQVQLLGDLCTVCAGKIVTLPLSAGSAAGEVTAPAVTAGPDGNAAAVQFALTLYHRWVLRTQLLRELPARLAKGMAAVSGPGAAVVVVGQAAAGVQLPNLNHGDLNSAFRADAFMASLDACVPQSLEYLHKLIVEDDAGGDGVGTEERTPASSTPFVTLVYDTFTAIGETPSMQQQQLGVVAAVPASISHHRQTFDSMLPISATELRTQIHFDLCTFYLHSKKYDSAREQALLCRGSLQKLRLEYERNPSTEPIVERSSSVPAFRFCTVDEADLLGCLRACGCDDPKHASLMHRLTESTLNNYAGLVEILTEDNRVKQIPLVNRRIVELDIEAQLSRSTAATSIGSEADALLVQVAALNTVRAALDRQHTLFTFGDFVAKYRHRGGMQQLVQHTAALVSGLKSAERHRLRQLFMRLLLTTLGTADSSRIGDDLETVAPLTALFAAGELDALRRRHVEQEKPTTAVPQLATMADWRVSETKDARLEAGTLKRQLVTCSSPQAVRQLLIKLAATKPSQPLWTVNPSWVLPMAVHAAVMSLQRGFLQDFAYILMGKSKELTDRNEFTGALAMLACLRTECARPDLLTNGVVRCLEKLLDWEVLFVQLAHTLHAWPRPCYDQTSLLQRCKQAMQLQQPVFPRTEVVMASATMLLNLGDWKFPGHFDWPETSFNLNLCAVFAAAAAEAEGAGIGAAAPKKMCRDAWEMVRPMFLLASGVGAGGAGGIGGGGGGGAAGGGGNNNNGGKQQRGGGGGRQENNNSGGGGGGPNAARDAVRDSPSPALGSILMPFLKQLRGVGIISIVLSLLAQLHNLLKDDSNMEIQTEHLSLWPTSMSNTSAYSIRAVCETLANLLKQGLHYHPQHLAWLRLGGEFEFVSENNESAMAHYVSVLLIGTEYCTLHVQQRQLLDDHMTRRMIKASLNLGCNIQAAILCQLLDEMDYALAFKCIAERTTFKNIGDKSAHYCDAMDAYYGCVWDATLLEYIIQQHCRKGEHKRKQQAIALISQLELNANNNEEIKREAASIRRTRFLRALAKQYML